MLILARVCADFYDKNRNLLHRITRGDLGTFREAPESIRQDPLFQMLVDDGSIKYPADAARDRSLEQDPFAGATADGRDIEVKPKAASKAKTESKSSVKTEAKTEEKPAGNPADTRTK